MTRRNWQEEIASATDHLLRQCRPLDFPVDLGKLAARRGVARIRFRPMPCDGAIEATGTGFEVHLRSDKARTVLLADVDTSQLEARVRFTLAHEIIHTFFYDERFRPIRPQPKKPVLEWLCNHGAARLLLPESLISREFGRGARLDSLERAKDLADVAKVSVFVVVRRLDECHDLKGGDYTLMILERRDDGSMVVLGACISGVFSAMPTPELYVKPPRWVAKIVPGLSRQAAGTSRVPCNHRMDFVSRVVPAGQNYVFVEIKLDLKEEALLPSQ